MVKQNKYTIRVMGNISILSVFFLLFFACNSGDRSHEKAHDLSNLSADTIRAISRDAYVYGYPMVENYRIIYQSTQEMSYAKYAPFNTFFHEVNVAMASDTLFVAPNGDTPYSYAVFDLRSGPVVLTIPAIDSTRYVGFPLYDMYTYIITTLSRRTIGTEGGSFLLARDNWNGEVPPGIRKVIRSHTDFVYTIVRTQLFGQKDLPNVHALQKQYGIQTLSAFLGAKNVKDGAAFTMPPLAPENPESPPNEKFFDVMNYVMSFCRPPVQEIHTLERFARIGIGPGSSFPKGDSVFRAAVLAGIRDAQALFLKKIGGIKSSAELFGTREQVGENYLARAVGAWVGIYANQPEEFLGLHGFDREADGEPFNGRFKYTFTFHKDSFPPVGAFWSVTLYHFPSRFMYANEINRNLVNNIMVSGMIRNEDSSVTVIVQHHSPGKRLEPNWLPCPEGSFTMAFRTYLPGEAIRNGSYLPPMVKKVP